MPMDRFTAFGLAVVLLGWVVLIADAALVPLLSTPGNLVSVTTFRSDVFSVAETTIVSGFGLAIIGVLRSGFGALHRFFDTVLERASAPRPTEVVAIEPIPVPTEIDPGDTLDRPPHQAPTRAHNYVILGNGAVEVETLLGTRIFASMDEARDYIR